MREACSTGQQHPTNLDSPPHPMVLSQCVHRLNAQSRSTSQAPAIAQSLYRPCHGMAVAFPRPSPIRRAIPLSEDVHYKILEERPEASQRQLSVALGVSLGKINYCVKALLDRGWIKATNFKNSKNKLAYA